MVTKQKKVKDPNIFSTMQKYALTLGINAALALQAMKYELFNFPVIEMGEYRVDVRMILVYLLSIITIMCILLSGFELFNKLQESKNILGRLKEELKSKDEEKENKNE